MPPPDDYGRSEHTDGKRNSLASPHLHRRVYRDRVQLQSGPPAHSRRLLCRALCTVYSCAVFFYTLQLTHLALFATARVYVGGSLPRTYGRVVSGAVSFGRQTEQGRRRRVPHPPAPWTRYAAGT